MKKNNVYSILACLLCVLLATGCGSPESFFGAKIKYLVPEQKAGLTSQELNIDFSPAIGAYGLCLADSLLVAEVPPGAGDMFVVYSKSNLSWLGSFVKEGNGPGELLMPMIIGGNGASEQMVCDINLNEIYRFDIPSSIENGHAVLEPIVQLEGMPLGAVSAGDSRFLYPSLDMASTGQVMLYSATKDSRASLVGSLFPGVDARENNVVMGFASRYDRQKDRYIMLMSGEPIINVLELGSGKRYSYSVEKGYNPSSEMTAVQYYGCVDAYDGGCIALYGSDHLHIFDEDFNFLCDVSLDSSLIYIAYDSDAEILYGLVEDGGIVSYDLSELNVQ